MTDDERVFDRARSTRICESDVAPSAPAGAIALPASGAAGRGAPGSLLGTAALVAQFPLAEADRRMRSADDGRASRARRCSLGLRYVLLGGGAYVISEILCNQSAGRAGGPVCVGGGGHRRNLLRTGVCTKRELWITKLFNDYLAGVGNALTRTGRHGTPSAALGQLRRPCNCWWRSIIIVLFAMLRPRLSVGQSRQTAAHLRADLRFPAANRPRSRWATTATSISPTSARSLSSSCSRT